MALCECGAEPTDNINGEKYCRSCGEHVRIDILIAKDDKTKAEKRELNKIEKERAKIARATHEKWNKFQESIGYKEPSEADIETVRKGT